MAIYPRLLLLGGVLLVAWIPRCPAAIQVDDQVKVEFQGEVAVFPRIAVPEKARLGRDWNKQCRAWEERVIAEPFRTRVGQEPWAGGAGKFISASLDAWHFSDGYEFHPELAAAGAALLQQGCQDPLVRYFAAYWESLNSQSRLERITRLIEPNCGYALRDGLAALDKMAPALDDLEKAGCAKAPLILYANTLASLWRYESVRSQETPLEKRIVNWLPTALSEGSYGPEDAPVFVGQMLRWDVKVDSQLHDAIAAIENSHLPEWARLTVGGDYHRLAAWQSRGGGTAEKVTESGWLGFEQQMQHSGESLATSWELAPTQAETATQMLPAILGAGLGQEPDALQWFQKAVGAEFDYFEAYDQWLWFHRPRWGGSCAQMLAFGRACAETRRYDTDVPEFFLRAVADVGSETAREPGGGALAIMRIPWVTETLLDVTRGELQDPSRKGQERKWRSLLAVRAWLTGKTDVAKAAFADLPDGRLDIAGEAELAAHSFPVEMMVNELAIDVTPAAPDFFAAQQAMRKHDGAEAVRRFRAALVAAPDDKALRHYLETSLLVAQFEQQFASGEWVHVPLALTAWQARQGNNFSNDADGAIVIQANQERPGYLHFRANLGQSYEVRGKFSPPHSDGPAAPTAFCVAFRGRNLASNQYLDFLATPSDAGRNLHGALQSLLRQLDEKGRKPASRSVENRPENDFLVRVTPSSVACELNGAEVVPKFSTNKWVAGFGTSYIGLIAPDVPADSTTRITSLEVRKLEGPEN